MNRLLWFALVFFIAAVLLSTRSAYANSYVGNGGNAGDVEWVVTLRQIQAGLLHAEQTKLDDEALCTCTETYTNHAICETLKSLSDEQARFCGSTLKAQIPVLKTLVSDNRNVRVSWTYDDIEVLEDGRRRAVDAVTDRSEAKITLNVPRFLAMNASERVFLISHELMHLTTLNGAPLTDEGAQGPYTTQQGSRQLINSMAAAVVLEADEAKAFERYNGTLKRPQGWKENWIDLSYGKINADPQSVYGIDDYGVYRVRFNHYFSTFAGGLSGLGMNVGYVELKGEKQTLATIQSKEKSQTFQAGVNYRIFPFKDPLSFFGQSHFVLSADVDYNQGTFNLKSTYNDETAIEKRLALSADVRYYIPVAASVWVTVGGSYQSLPRRYVLFPGSASQTVVENRDNQFAASLGVSYGF